MACKVADRSERGFPVILVACWTFFISVTGIKFPIWIEDKSRPAYRASPVTGLIWRGPHWCLDNKQNITWPLGDTKFLRSLVKYFSTLEEKFRISARSCNILYILPVFFFIITGIRHEINGYSETWSLGSNRSPLKLSTDKKKMRFWITGYYCCALRVSLPPREIFKTNIFKKIVDVIDINLKDVKKSTSSRLLSELWMKTATSCTSKKMCPTWEEKTLSRLI